MIPINLWASLKPLSMKQFAVVYKEDKDDDGESA